MKRKLTLLTAIMASAAMAHARQLTPAESLQRYADAQPALHKAQGVALTQMQLGYTSAIDAATNAFYVFEYPQRKGFVILGADDLVPEVLGYSEEGSFDPDRLPEGLAYWTRDLNRQIALAVKAGVPLYSSTSRHDAGRATIAPLVSSIWGQGDEDSPFDDDCPSYGGEKCVAGCVAAAMAQVMYAHKYPTRGQGSNSYTTSTLGIAQSANFNTIYNWSAMLDAYGYTYTETGDSNYEFNYYSNTQGSAVAKLMHHCGVSVNMDYNVASTGGSGTLSHYVMPALYKYFKYDAAGRFCQRDYCTDEEWEELVYGELAAGRPVFYSGATSTSGHAFVLDGYQSGYYHVNWGWDNLCNGYYAITGTDPLHPAIQGTGGSVVDEGFRYQQDCIAGVRPAVSGSRITPNFFLEGRKYTILDIDQNETEHLNADDYGVLYVPDGMIYSVSNDKMEVCLSAKLVNCETHAVHYAIVYDDESDEFDVLNGLRGYYFRTEDIPDGQYSVYPTLRTTGENTWFDVHLPTGMAAPKVIIGDYTPTPTHSNAELACSAFTLNKASTTGRNVSAEMANVLNVSSDNSAFWGELAIGVYDKNGSLACVLTEGQHTVTEQSKLEHYKYFTNPISVTGYVPTSLADGQYTLSPVALQKGSATWTSLGIFDTTAMTYDMRYSLNIPMTIERGKVMIEGADPDPADNYAVYISDDVTISGSSLTLPISMQNAEAICGLQFDVTLPSGVSYRKADGRYDITLSTARTTAAKTDVFDFEKLTNGPMRIVLCSTNGTAFAGKDGEVALLKLNVTNTRQKSGFALKISNIVLTDAKAKAYKLPDYETTISPANADGIDGIDTDAHTTCEVYHLDGTRTHSATLATGKSSHAQGGILIYKNGKAVRKQLFLK